MGDNQPLTAARGLGLSNQLGGIVQSLMVFKGVSTITQITGDSTTSNLNLNTLNVATGTLSPRSISSTPLGLPFASPEGMRLLDLNANVSDPIGKAGEGITEPFSYAVNPTRMCAASSASIYRVSLQSGTTGGNPFVEYWYDIPRKVWSGPHTFPASMIDVYQDTFIKAPVAVVGSLWQSFTIPSNTTGVIENGATLQWSLQSVVWSTADSMSECEVTEMFVISGGGSLQGLNTFNVTILDGNGASINTSQVTYQTLGSLWGSSIWGVALWGATANLTTFNVNFDAPVVYSRAALMINGAAFDGFKLGDTFVRRRELGYMPHYLGVN